MLFVSGNFILRVYVNTIYTTLELNRENTAEKNKTLNQIRMRTNTVACTCVLRNYGVQNVIHQISRKP